jgi:hypothetical protein
MRPDLAAIPVSFIKTFTSPPTRSKDSNSMHVQKTGRNTGTSGPLGNWRFVDCAGKIF